MGKTSFSSRPFSATALFRKEFQQGDRIVRHDKIPREKTVRENHFFRRMELQLSRIRRMEGNVIPEIPDSSASVFRVDGDLHV